MNAHRLLINDVGESGRHATERLVLLNAFCLCNVVAAIALASKPDLHGRRIGRDEVDRIGTGEGGNRDQDHCLASVSVRDVMLIHNSFTAKE